MSRSLHTLAVTLLATGFALADETYRAKDGGYEVEFPGTPKVTTQAAKSSLGNLQVVRATYATSAGDVYVVSHTTFPAAAIRPDIHPTLFDGVREGLKGDDGKVDSDKAITLGKDKLPGREVVIDKGKVRTRVRVYIKGEKLYLVMVMGSPKFVADDDADDFFKSFEFKD